MPGRTTLIVRIGVLAAVVLAAACSGDQTPSAPTPGGAVPLTGFTLTGDPGSSNGANWTYKAQVSGVDYDLQGILLKPSGAGPFPAVIISHGSGGNASGYSRAVARVMVGWGLVCIATNYTHSGGVAIGSPGTAADAGGSTANILRARQLVEIVRGLGYVDTNRLALHGHSMGAFVTAATAGAYPDLFRVASHTAGGISTINTAAAPSEAKVAGIRAPYQMHHGDQDMVVSLAADQQFASVLQSHGVVYELVIYPGADHDDVSINTTVLDRVRVWYASKGLF